MNEVLLLDKVTNATTVNTESLAFHPFVQMAIVVGILVGGCLIATWMESPTARRATRKGRRKSTLKRTKRR